MADPYYALRDSANIALNRGGVTEARLRGVNALTGLRMAENQMNRANEEWGLRKPVLERQANEAKYFNEEIPINARDVLPKDLSGISAATTPDKHGTANLDIINSMLPGSNWDDKGNRIDSKGDPVTIPRWKWEQRFKPGLMMTYIARTDPVKKLSDAQWEINEQIKAAKDDPQIYNKLLEKKNQVDSVLSDKKQMAMLYGRQAQAINEALAWAISTGADPRFIQMLDREQQRTIGKADKLIGTEKGNLELQELKLRIENAKLQREKILSRGGLTKNQEYGLNAKAVNAVNTRLANDLTLQAKVGQMSQDQYDKWFAGEVEKTKKMIMPDQTMGLGGDQTGGRGTEGQFKVGEIRLAPEGTRGAGRYWQYGQDGQWYEVPGPKGTEQAPTASYREQGNKKTASMGNTGGVTGELPEQAKLPKTLDELEKMIPPRKMKGIYKEDYPWEYGKSIGERAAKNIGQRTQKGQSPNVKRMGEGPAETAIRQKTGIEDLYKLKEIKEKIQYIYPDMTDKDIANAVKTGRLFGEE